MPTVVPLTQVLCPYDRRVNRLTIETRLRLPSKQLDLVSDAFVGVVDTGAQRTLISREAVDWFEGQVGGLLIKGPPMRLAVADGHEYDNVPGYFLDLEFTIRSDPARGVRASVVRTGPHGRSGTVPLCYALPTPISARTKTPCVLIGMDLIRDWRLVADGPRSSYFMEL